MHVIRPATFVQIDSYIKFRQTIFLYLFLNHTKLFTEATMPKKFFNKCTLLSLYYSLVYPYLTYCIQIWGSTYDSHLVKLIVLQKKIIRIISGVPPRTHTDALFKELKVMKMKDLYSYNVDLFMYKFDLCWLPDIFPMFIRNKEIHAHNTRQTEYLHIPLCRLNSSKMSVKYLGPKIWNTLVKYIDVYCSIGIFKRSVKSYLCMNSLIP